jgi:hypothetical protein
MSTGSLRMQSLSDHALMIDVIKLLTTLRMNRHAFNPLPNFPLIVETMSNHLQQLQ